MRRRIGLVGFGYIGENIYRRIVKAPDLDVAFVYTRDPRRLKDVPWSDVIEDLDDFATREADLIVEMAHPDITRRHGEAFLRKADYMMLSVTALSDAALEARLTRPAADAGTTLYLPHGALVGCDSLYEWREQWQEVTITFRKHPQNIDFSESGIDPAGIAKARPRSMTGRCAASRACSRATSTPSATCALGHGRSRPLPGHHGRRSRARRRDRRGRRRRPRRLSPRDRPSASRSSASPAPNSWSRSSTRSCSPPAATGHSPSSECCAELICLPGTFSLKCRRVSDRKVIMRWFLALIGGLMIAATGAGTADAQDKENILYLDLTSGRVVIQLRPDMAPKHVARIKELVREGFYNGIVFHRVIPGFMAQTGDPTGTGTGGSGKNLPAEFSQGALRARHDRHGAHPGPEQRRQPVLHHVRAGAAPERPVHGLGQGDRGHAVRRQDQAGRPPSNPDKIVKMRVAADVKG